MSHYSDAYEFDNWTKKHPEGLPGDDYKSLEDFSEYTDSEKMILARYATNYTEVCHPEHYNQGNIECIDAITAATVNKTGIEAVCVANVIKYLWRYEKKGGKKDVEKAKWYLDRLLENL